jgi:hypothetical protein
MKGHADRAKHDVPLAQRAAPDADAGGDADAAGGLVQGGEEIGSIIEVPDDAEIGFEGQMPDKTFERIFVKLTPGQAVRLHRATQAMMVQPSQPVVFEVSS